MAGRCTSNDDLRPGSVLAFGSWLVLSSSLFGAVTAALTVAIVKQSGTPTIKVALLITGSYGVYYVAGDALGISGVLAIVVYGIRCSVGSRYCKLNSALSLHVRLPRLTVFGRLAGMDANTLRQNHAVWQVLAWMANTGIFMLSGVMVAVKVFGREDLVWSTMLLTSFVMVSSAKHCPTFFAPSRAEGLAIRSALIGVLLAVHVYDGDTCADHSAAISGAFEGWVW